MSQCRCQLLPSTAMSESWRPFLALLWLDRPTHQKLTASELWFSAISTARIASLLFSNFQAGCFEGKQSNSPTSWILLQLGQAEKRLSLFLLFANTPQCFSQPTENLASSHTYQMNRNCREQTFHLMGFFQNPAAL